MWEMGKKKEGEAASFFPAIGFPLLPIDVGPTGFPQLPSGLMSCAIVSPYSLLYLPPPATPAKNPDSFQET